MIVCKRCLEAIECHEGHQIKKKLDYDDDVEIVDDELVLCEWCEEYHPIDDMWII